MHHTPLLTTLAAGFVLAFLFGALANRLRISPLVGYLLAGVLAGPFTPGYVADQALSQEIAELGVILLMFGVGLHFSLKDLLSVKAIAIPGALVQIGVATLLGIGLAKLLGWSFGGGLVFGLSLSVASTVVLLRALEQRQLLDTKRGRIAIGWLIVEDLAMVLTLVLLPALAGTLGGKTDGGDAGLLWPLLITLGKVAAFVALMIFGGRRVVPWVLERIAASGSRELFTLAVLAIALGIAYGSAVLFGVSFALGAFFAGMILNESELSHEAAENSLPLRDAFAVLFFVSVGMLFNPMILLQEPLTVLATFLVIVFGKSVAAYLIVRAFGHPNSTALVIAASLAQIGEFSFILASLGTGLGVLPADARDLILAGAMVSIFLNPILFSMIVRDHRKDEDEPSAADRQVAQNMGHTILVGYGRVGKLIAARLAEKGVHFVVMEDDKEKAEEAGEAGHVVVRGNAMEDRHLRAANIGEARNMLIAVPEGFEGGAIHEHARHLNPTLTVIARAHSDAEVAHLESLGVPYIVMGERELAARMLTLCGAI